MRGAAETLFRLEEPDTAGDYADSAYQLIL